MINPGTPLPALSTSACISVEEGRELGRVSKSDPLLTKLKHPLLFISPELASSLGILHPTEGVALRATIIADSEGVVRFASANDLSVGRNVDEVLRVLDGLQTGELTACNWKPGEPTLG